MSPNPPALISKRTKCQSEGDNPQRVRGFPFASLPGREWRSCQALEALGLAVPTAISRSATRLKDCAFHDQADSGRPINVHCEIYRMVEAQAPSVSIPAYFLRKVRAGRPDLQCGGAVGDVETWVTINTFCMML